MEAAIGDWPAGVNETEWLNSVPSMELPSSIRRTGQNEVFGESLDTETFSLMIGVPIAIYLPSNCELYPQSKYCKLDLEYLVGICNENHYFLAVPKRWIVEEQGHITGQYCNLCRCNMGYECCYDNLYDIYNMHLIHENLYWINF